MRSIDHRRLTAVVHARATGLGDEVLILATPQAPAEIERGLRRAGRAPVGTDVYALKTGDAGADLDDLDTMAFGHGLVVLASSAGVARGVLRRTAPEPRLKAELALADSVGGDMRTVSIGAPISDDAQCIHALAGGERFDKGDQKLVLVLGERPSSRRVVLDQGVNDQDILSAGYDVRDVQVDGRTITLTLRVTSDTLGLTSAASIADGDLPAEQVYRCLGSPAPKPAQAPSAATTPTGTQLERSIALYVAAGSLAPNLVRVHCPPGSSRADRNVHCTGTRADRGRTYHYVITAHFSPGGHFLGVDIDSKDDRTKTIV
jgi:hypothetical protein